MTSFQKALEIDLMEFTRDISLMEDVDYIAFIEGDYYEESGDSKKPNIFEKAIKYVRDLIKKIKDKLSEKFSEANVKKQQEKLKMEILSDPNKKNKKVKVRVNDKVYALDKKALGDLTKCKTKDQVEKYMKDYKKKREKLVAGSIVAVSATTAIGILGSKLHKTHKQLDELQGEYEKSIERIKEETWRVDNLKDQIAMMNRINEKQKKVSDKKNREELDRVRGRNKRLIEMVRDNKSSSKKKAEIIAGYANRVKLNAKDNEYRNYLYNFSLTSGMYDGDMDRANRYADRLVTSDILNGMNHIIRVSTSMGADLSAI